jgi:thiamine-phosphate pyrophosphorylase
MTDDLRLPDPIAAARALPKGAAIILRMRDSVRRAHIAGILARIARARGLVLLIAGDAALAQRCKAQGLHLPEARAREAAHWKALHPGWLVTVAAHSERTLARAAVLRADAALLGPIFPTGSHEGHVGLGLLRARAMAARSHLPLYALGGVDARTIGRLAGARFAGIAAIGALDPAQRS